MFVFNLAKKKFATPIRRRQNFCILKSSLLPQSPKARNKSSSDSALVEARRVELLSENPFARFSTSVVGALSLSSPYAHRRAYGNGSLLIPPQVRRTLRLVPHIDDARILRRGQRKADGRAVRQRRAYSCCCQLYLMIFPFFTKHGASTRLSGIRDPRRNQVRPQVFPAGRSTVYYTHIEKKINLFSKNPLTLTLRYGL